MFKRKICVVTGTRAEYGLLRPVMILLSRDASIRLQVVATGAHLLREFGSTYKIIEADGFKIDCKVRLPLGKLSRYEIVRGMGAALSDFASAYKRLSPDLVLLLGDRYEALLAAEAALIFGIPIAHISGGEVTYGAFDDSIRHSISKMAALHFPATKEYGRRLVQLGEAPSRIHVVGDPGVENAARMKLLSKHELASALKLSPSKRWLTVTYHAETANTADPARDFEEILAALKKVGPDVHIVFTRPGADPGNAVINRLIDSFVGEQPSRAVAFASLGQLRYLSLVKHSEAVVGNSSSGIIEAPALRTPTVDVGARQAGRLRAASVTNTPANRVKIAAAIMRAQRVDCEAGQNPYFHRNTSLRIARILKAQDLSKLMAKRFFDIEVDAFNDRP